MSKSLFQKHSKMMGSIWNKAKKQADSGNLGDLFDDGRYKMYVSKAEATESQKKDFMVVLSLCFLEGEYLGKIKKVFRVITPNNAEKNLARILLDINKFGYEIEDFDQIESVLEEITESRPVVRVTLKTRSESDYQDGYIDKLLTGEEAENSEDVVDSGDEIPEEEESVGEDTVEVGSLVTFTWKGKTFHGEIKEFYEDDTKAKVKSGGKVYPVKLEDISLEEKESEEEPEEIPEEPEEEPISEEETVENHKPTKKVVKKVGKSLKKKKKKK